MKRFEEKFEVVGDCWLWTAGTVGLPGDLPGDRGYGQFYYEGRPHVAHRVSWMLYRGEIPAGAMVCHTCDNRSCVNPDHLYVGDARTNAMDKMVRGRWHGGAPDGEAHGNSKLNEAAALDIRTRAEPQSVYMARYGVSRSAVSDVQNGVTWAWLGRREPRMKLEANVVVRGRRQKLSDADVCAIRESGELHQVLADRYGCSAAYVGMLKKGLRRAS